MIVNDQKAATLIASSFLALGLLLVPASSVSAADALAASPVTAADQSTAATATVTIFQDGAESTFPTHGRTVGDVLAERDVHVASGDLLTPAADTSIVDGLRITVRTAIPVQLRVENTTRSIRTVANTVGELLRAEGVKLGRFDEVTPGVAAPLETNATVAVVRVREWTERERERIAQKTVRRDDASLGLGMSKTLAAGAPGVRETTIRYTVRNDDAPTTAVVASRVVRPPHAKIVARGLAASLARVAAVGFASAIHMAGSALHMIATAYTAGCYGCSGITASGVRAGFGVIAVDPSVIPLGTRVFIPGYGRAVAGDTGGAILGHRVDLGFNSESAALRFGRRPVMLYVLR